MKIVNARIHYGIVLPILFVIIFTITNVSPTPKIFNSQIPIKNQNYNIQSQQSNKEIKNIAAFATPNNEQSCENDRNLLSRTKETLQTFVKTLSKSKHHLAAAAIARGASIFIMYPIDTIKTRIQMSSSGSGLAGKLNIGGLYQGVIGSLIGQVPYGVLTFGSYEMYKQMLSARFSSDGPFVYALAAVLGDVTGSFYLCPSEVVKQQLQAGMYSSTTEAISKIFSKQGFFGFYQGYFGGLARDVPFRVAQLTSYEITKKFYLSYKASLQAKEEKEGKPELTAVEASICGAIAGTFSSAITTPLDRVKTLLMTGKATSVLSCVEKIWREEGLRGFSTGIVPRVGYIAPSVAIFFVVYEQVQQRFMT